MTIQERLLSLAETRAEIAWINRMLDDVRGEETTSRQRAWERYHERREAFDEALEI